MSECRHADRRWSWNYGTSPRRVYWHCQRCDMIGAILYPRASEVYMDAHQFVEVEHRDGVVVEGDTGAMPAEVAWECIEFALCDRNTFVELEVAEIPRLALEGAFNRGADVSREKYREAYAQAELYRRKEHESLRDRLNRLIGRKKRRPAPARTLRPKGIRSPLPVLCRGCDVADPVIYGLVDPRAPEVVRYVGQTVSPVNRLASHLKDARDTGGKADWIRALAAEGVYPDMVLLERVRPGADMNSAESAWIHTYRDREMADLNTSLPRSLRLA